MKILTNIKKYINLILILFVFSSLHLLGRDIVNKKFVYTLPNNLAKTNSSEYLSKIIEIPIKSADPFIAIGFSAELKSPSSSCYFSLRVSKDGMNWTEWFAVVEEEEGSEGNKYLAKLNFFDKSNKFLQFKSNNGTNLNSLTFSFISPGKTSDLQISENIKKSKLSKIDRWRRKTCFCKSKRLGMSSIRKC